MDSRAATSRRTFTVPLVALAASVLILRRRSQGSSKLRKGTPRRAGRRRPAARDAASS